MLGCAETSIDKEGFNCGNISLDTSSIIVSGGGGQSSAIMSDTSSNWGQNMSAAADTCSLPAVAAATTTTINEGDDAWSKQSWAPPPTQQQHLPSAPLSQPVQLSSAMQPEQQHRLDHYNLLATMPSSSSHTTNSLLSMSMPPPMARGGDKASSGPFVDKLIDSSRVSLLPIASEAIGRSQQHLPFASLPLVEDDDTSAFSNSHNSSSFYPHGTVANHYTSEDSTLPSFSDRRKKARTRTNSSGFPFVDDLELFNLPPPPMNNGNSQAPSSTVAATRNFDANSLYSSRTNSPNQLRVGLLNHRDGHNSLLAQQRSNQFSNEDIRQVSSGLGNGHLLPSQHYALSTTASTQDYSNSTEIFQQPLPTAGFQPPSSINSHQTSLEMLNGRLPQMLPNTDTLLPTSTTLPSPAPTRVPSPHSYAMGQRARALAASQASSPYIQQQSPSWQILQQQQQQQQLPQQRQFLRTQEPQPQTQQQPQPSSQRQPQVPLNPANVPSKHDSTCPQSYVYYQLHPHAKPNPACLHHAQQATTPPNASRPVSGDETASDPQDTDSSPDQTHSSDQVVMDAFKYISEQATGLPRFNHHSSSRRQETSEIHDMMASAVAATSGRNAVSQQQGQPQSQQHELVLPQPNSRAKVGFSRRANRSKLPLVIDCNNAGGVGLGPHHLSPIIRTADTVLPASGETLEGSFTMDQQPLTSVRPANKAKRGRRRGSTAAAVAAASNANFPKGGSAHPMSSHTHHMDTTNNTQYVQEYQSDNHDDNYEGQFSSHHQGQSHPSGSSSDILPVPYVSYQGGQDQHEPYFDPQDPYYDGIGQDYNSSERPSGRRHQVKVACVHCKKACKRCDNERPCSRCKRLRIPDCTDAPRKTRARGFTRGPYKKKGGGGGGRKGSIYSTTSDQTLVMGGYHQSHAGGEGDEGGFGWEGSMSNVVAEDGVGYSPNGGTRGEGGMTEMMMPLSMSVHSPASGPQFHQAAPAAEEDAYFQDQVLNEAEFADNRKGEDAMSEYAATEIFNVNNGQPAPHNGYIQSMVGSSQTGQSHPANSQHLWE